MSTTPNPSEKRSRRKIAFRCAALLLGLLPIVLIEVVLRMMGLGTISERHDPFIGFESVSNLFERRSGSNRYVIAESRLDFFQPDDFPATKGENEYRIFCLGGSTVQGRPYSIETSFTSWLELSLRAADSSREWRVVNCGGVSYASYRLVPILQEVLEYQPDMIIVYSGHNEFLEDRTYQHVKEVPAWLQTAHRWMSNLRVYNAGRELLRGRDGRAGVPQLPGEVEARLDFWGGLEKFHRDDAWSRAVVAHYENNLQRMVALCRDKRVPLIVVAPVSNLKDTPPFKFQQGPISREQAEEFARLWGRARAKETPLAERIRLLRAAVAIDPRHAGAVFHLGKCYEAASDWKNALDCFRRAQEEDVCPLRMTEPLHNALRRVVRRNKTTLVDVRLPFLTNSEGGIPGREVFVDHVHPTITGHKWIAQALFDELVARRVVRPRPGMARRRAELYRVHFESLPPLYEVRAKERLEGLRIWTQGKVPRYK